MARSILQPPIQFLVVGAQKAGTTSLFRYLSAHPQIYMPSEKEVAFFSDDSIYSKGYAAYIAEYFTAATPGRVCGEASPHYMCYHKCPERIRNHLPNAKIIAVLRNPIDRAYSHFRMARRRGLEQRPFLEAVEAQIERGHISDDEVDLQRDYVPFSEYGRILRNFLRSFDRSQIRLVWSDELNASVHSCMQWLYRFLSVDPGFSSHLFTRRFHESGSTRLPGWLDRLCRSGISRCGKVIGSQRERAIAFWYETEFNIRRVDDAGPSPSCRSTLLTHYVSDLALLQEDFGIIVPWQEFRSVMSQKDGARQGVIGAEEQNECVG